MTEKVKVLANLASKSFAYCPDDETMFLAEVIEISKPIEEWVPEDISSAVVRGLARKFCPAQWDIARSVDSEEVTGKFIIFKRTPKEPQEDEVIFGKIQESVATAVTDLEMSEHIPTIVFWRT